MHSRFTITYDYLCPFARIANEAVAEALDAGADYEVLFAPFSLHQNSLDAGEAAVWDDPEGASRSGVLALARYRRVVNVPLGGGGGVYSKLPISTADPTTLLVP